MIHHAIHHAIHHDLTIKSPHQTLVFFQNTLKNTPKHKKAGPRSISGFFPQDFTSYASSSRFNRR